MTPVARKLGRLHCIKSNGRKKVISNGQLATALDSKRRRRGSGDGSRGSIGGVMLMAVARLKMAAVEEVVEDASEEEEDDGGSGGGRRTKARTRPLVARRRKKIRSLVIIWYNST